MKLTREVERMEEKETLEGQVRRWRKKATALEQEVGVWMKAVKVE